MTNTTSTTTNNSNKEANTEASQDESEGLDFDGKRALAEDCLRDFLIGYSGRTAETYADTMKLFFAWVDDQGESDDGRITVFDVDRTTMNEYRAHCEERGLAPATLARYISIISAFYEYCLDEEIILANPARRINRPRVSGESSTNGLTREEATLLLREAELTDKREHLIIAFLLLSGLRVSELCGLRVEDVSYNRGHRVAIIHGKGGKVRNAPMSELTSKLFDDYVGKRKSGPVFPGRQPGTQIDRHTVGRMVKNLIKGCGIQSRITPHSLRHSFVTLALDSGAPLRDVQDAAGHASPETTRRYDRSRHNLDRHPTYRLSDYITGSD